MDILKEHEIRTSSHNSIYFISNENMIELSIYLNSCNIRYKKTHFTPQNTELGKNEIKT